MNTEVDGCTLTGFDNLVVKLFLYLCNNLLNACRVNTPVCNELVESKTTNLTTDRVEARDYDSFRSIIDYDFNATGSFKSADVTTFTTDDTTFNLIILDMENAY